MKNIISLIIIILMVTLIYGTSMKLNSTIAKERRLSCQEATITFERVFTDQPVIKAIDLLESNNYKINSYIDYSKYMKSHLKNILSEKEAVNRLEHVLERFVTNTSLKNEKIEIKYYLYENDKKDSNKKGKKSKLYAGYVLLEFKLNSNSVYKIQTDYMDKDLKDLNERIECAVQSFISLK